MDLDDGQSRPIKRKGCKIQRRRTRYSMHLPEITQDQKSISEKSTHSRSLSSEEDL